DIVQEEPGRADQSTRGMLTVHAALVTKCIEKWGTAQQKTKWLKELIIGKTIGCYALTEPEAGSDAAAIQTIAKKTSGGYSISGEKIWITNANIAGLAIVFAKLESLSKEKPHRQITAFLVPTNSK